jgi:exodeoxyribonuclease VIII
MTDKLTNEQHHAHPAIGSSDLKLYRRSPLHYWHRKHSPDYEPRVASNAMQLGTALHLALLEPEAYTKAVGTALPIPKTSAANKAAHAEHNAKYELTLPAADIAKVTGMREAALRHPVIAKVTQQVLLREHSFFVDDPTTGLQLKIRPDAITSNGWLLDVKTTSDARDAKFKWSVRDYGYDHQAAFYLKCLHLLPPEAVGVEVRGQLLVLIENEAPFAARVVRIPDAVINQAAAINEATLEGIAEHTQLLGPQMPWPAYEPTIATLDL